MKSMVKITNKGLGYYMTGIGNFTGTAGRGHKYITNIYL